jgi:hypothetical protein
MVVVRLSRNDFRFYVSLPVFPVLGASKDEYPKPPSGATDKITFRVAAKPDDEL